MFNGKTISLKAVGRQSPLPISPRAVVDFTPPHRRKEERPPVYRVCAASFDMRRAFKRKLAEEGLRTPTNVEVRQHLRRAVRSVVEEAEQEAALDALKQFEELAEKDLEHDPDERDRFEQLADEVDAMARRLAPHYGPLGRALGDRAESADISALYTARFFLAGWSESVGVPFETEGGLVKAELIERLPPADIDAIAGEAMRLLEVDPVTAKNSDAPSTSSSTPATSTAPNGSETATAGTSTAGSTDATPAA